MQVRVRFSYQPNYVCPTHAYTHTHTHRLSPPPPLPLPNSHAQEPVSALPAWLNTVHVHASILPAEKARSLSRDWRTRLLPVKYPTFLFAACTIIQSAQNNLAN
ncbi:hypothetical protein ACJBU6_01246 [Exserohilum turcicum]